MFSHRAFSCLEQVDVTYKKIVKEKLIKLYHTSVRREKIQEKSISIIIHVCKHYKTTTDKR